MLNDYKVTSINVKKKLIPLPVHLFNASVCANPCKLTFYTRAQNDFWVFTDEDDRLNTF